MKKLMFSAVALSFVLAACGDSSEEQNEQEQNQDQEQTGYTVEDARGMEFTFEEPPETIVSILPSNTEIIFALGQGDKVVGVSDTDVYPEEVEDIEVVAEFENPYAERMLELDPDIIIGYEYGNNEMEQLNDLDLPAFAIDSAATMDDIFEDIQLIADALGVPEEGEQLINDMNAEFDEIAEAVEGVEERSVYFEISPSPDIWTLGTGTFQHEMIEIAGLQNVFDDVQGWTSISDEQVIERDPEFIYTTVHYTEAPLEEIRQRDGWDTIDAVENDNLEQMPPDIMDRPGPRITEATRILAETAYPEAFE
ncbi:ABC transporter substrate-binding protein [Shouchella sp. JSM 1781072]|uniref:ABC transporter substrate-binding protein n=1 Tax=Bacillaceae TaxID=186817 RepID=UPI0020D12D8B|nr:ABC transporter substrate-binding protein [Alkalihalobacillus sp. LMS6]UTR05532.1 ABC transporter substrate-binding protein [Alkalihalobacillus sp. LMS6]